MHSIPLYLCWDGDHVAADVRLIELQDDPDRLRQLFQRIDKGNLIVRAWVEGVGGSIISMSGCSGSAEVQAERVAELPKIRLQYSEAMEAPFSVGVGSKLSEAQKALTLVKLRGGDQILLYTPDVDKEIGEGPEKDEKDTLLAKGLKQAVVGGVMAAGLMASSVTREPTQAPKQVKQVVSPKPWSPAGLSGDLFPIAHLESSFGKNTKHSSHSGDEFQTAVGAVGLKPVTAHEEFMRSPELQRRFPGLFDKVKFLKAMQADHGFYNQIATSHWDRMKKQLHNKIDRVAFAWRWGKNAALHAAPDRIKADPYVKKYMTLRSKGVFKMESEDFDVDELIKDAPEPSFDKPKVEASEHSEGEVADHIFDEAHGEKKPITDVKGHLHKLASAQSDSDKAEESQKEQDKELTKIKSGVVTILQHVQKLQPKFEELAQSNPEVYKTLLEMVQGMITMAKEFDAAPIQKSELAKAIPSVPKPPKPGTRQHLKLPVGSKIDGAGKIKVQHQDGSTSWIEARSGQIASQDHDSVGNGGEVHAISARNPGGR